MAHRFRLLLSQSQQDVRFGLRQWRLAPIFTATALIVLAAGTGANLALFGLFDALILRALPVHRPDQLVAFSAFDSKHPDFANLAPYTAFEPFRRAQTVFSNVAASLFSSATVETDGTFSEVPIAFIDDAYFDVLQVGVVRGRGLSSEDVKTAARVAVMTDDEWQRHGRDPDVVGKIIRLQNQPVTIVGVAASGFCTLTTDSIAAYAMPITTARALFESEGLGTDEPLPLQYGVGRLRPAVTLDEARAQLQALWPNVRQAVVPAELKAGERDEFLSLELKVESAARGFSLTRDWFASPLALLASATAWLLLIACANLAGLMLSRALLRKNEMAVRAALGASRGRLARQWLTEGLLISTTGTALGLPIALLSMHALSARLFSIWAADPNFRLNLTPDWRLASVTVASALITGSVIGLGPISRASRRLPTPGARQTIDARASRWIDRLLIGQVALALVLIVGAGLFARSLSNLRRVNPGFRTSGIAVVDVAMQPGRDVKSDPVAYTRTLRDHLLAIPGVEAVGFSAIPPAWGFAPGELKLLVAPSDAQHASDVEATFLTISPGYFDALEVPVRAGRDFVWTDDPSNPRAAIVSARLAAKLFGDRDPIGREIRVGAASDLQRIPIVGVSADARLADLHTREPLFVFLPLLQAHEALGRMPGAIEIRSAGAFGTLQARISREVQTLDQQFVYQQLTLGDQVEHSLLRERLLVAGGYAFGGMAIAIVVTGLFGLLASIVEARTPELAVRTALGATAGSLQWLIVKRAGGIAAVGVAIGLPLLWMAGRWLNSVLIDVSPQDPLSISTAIAVLAMASALAAWWPARRAARVDPIEALKHE
jgi:predicted permease